MKFGWPGWILELTGIGVTGVTGVAVALDVEFDVLFSVELIDAALDEFFDELEDDWFLVGSCRTNLKL